MWKHFVRMYHFFTFVCLCAQSNYARPPLAMCRVCVCLCRSAVYCLVSCLVSAGASYIIATTNNGAASLWTNHGKSSVLTCSMAACSAPLQYFIFRGKFGNFDCVEVEPSPVPRIWAKIQRMTKSLFSGLRYASVGWWGARPRLGVDNRILGL